MAKPAKAGGVYCIYNIGAVCFPMLIQVLLMLLLALTKNLRSALVEQCWQCSVGLVWGCLHCPDHELLGMLSLWVSGESFISPSMAPWGSPCRAWLSG